MPTAPNAIVIADSVSPTGQRLTTVTVTLHRFVLAELNTHRVLSRNSASSRAIPVRRQLDRVADDPAWPLQWPREQRGMQGGDELDGQDYAEARELFDDVHRYATERVRRYLDEHEEPPSRLHKSLVNRLLEPFMWHTVILTGTDWEGFFDQRVSELAQPEIAAPAKAILEAVAASEPTLVDYGDWHLPYTADLDVDLRSALKISAARCARVSYLTHDGVRDPEKDLELYNKLTSADPMHASPFEHQATPAPQGLPAPGNLRGWFQQRHWVEQGDDPVEQARQIADQAASPGVDESEVA